MSRDFTQRCGPPKSSGLRFITRIPVERESALDNVHKARKLLEPCVQHLIKNSEEKPTIVGLRLLLDVAEPANSSYPLITQWRRGNSSFVATRDAARRALTGIAVREYEEGDKAITTLPTTYDRRARFIVQDMLRSRYSSDGVPKKVRDSREERYMRQLAKFPAASIYHLPVKIWGERADFLWDNAQRSQLVERCRAGKTMVSYLTGKQI